MPLESLLQLVETLRERIESHGAALSDGEMPTRYALIDPLLRELGWNISDPTMVIPEYRSGTGKPDYALFADGRLRLVVEAKKLWAPLGNSVLSQVTAYSQRSGSTYFAATNGAHWKVYRTSSRKLMAEFTIGKWLASLWSPNTPSSETVEECRNAVPLWRPGNWHQLADIEYAAGLKPIELLCPDDYTVKLKSWRDLLVEVLRWLTANSLLTPSDCPIRPENTVSKRYLFNYRPYHRSRKRFISPSEEVNGIYAELDYGADSLASNAKDIIDYVGEDLDDFKVRFS